MVRIGARAPTDQTQREETLAEALSMMARELPDVAKMMRHLKSMGRGPATAVTQLPQQ